MTRHILTTTGLSLALLLTIAVYWAGLHGPFVFDDEANFAIFRRWLDQEIGWRQVIFGVDSGPGGRPLSIASFMLSAWLGGLTPFAFKTGSLVLHLGNGVLVYALASRLARRDPIYAPHAAIAALVLASLWLLHPLLVSTVLYAVQRMAMLSTTFILLGLSAYWQGRLALEAGRQRAGFLWLFVAVPILTLVAASAKENGLLLPLLCAVLEACYFRPASGRRPAIARAFILVAVVLPVVAAFVVVALRPDLIVGGYAGRSFTLEQRLLTEARVLWDYVASILLPWGPRLSLYRDDYVVSTGLLSPPGTLVAMLGWCAILIVAWRVRRNLPALAAGLGIFLVGHSMESTVIPLLLYFEHRNYMPAIGILWAAGALLIAATTRLAPHMTRPRAVFASGLVLLLLVFAVATYARARVWADKDVLLASSLKASPNSRWVRMDLALTALQKKPPNAAAARQHYAALQMQADPISQQIGRQGLVVVGCGIDGRVAASSTNTLFSQTGQQIEPDQYQMLDLLGGLLLNRPCDGLPAEALANKMAAWLDKSPTPEHARVKLNLRYLAARLYLEAGQRSSALRQASVSWDAGARELPLAAMMIDIHVALGERSEAKRLLAEIMPHIPSGERRAAEVFSQLRRKVDASSD